MHIHSKSSVYTCFLDSSKAFDMVNLYYFEWCTAVRYFIAQAIFCLHGKIYGHVFYTDNLCLRAIALQELLNMCHNEMYSIIVDSNFNVKKSFCFAFTPRLFKLSLPYLLINNISTLYMYVD